MKTQALVLFLASLALLVLSCQEVNAAQENCATACPALHAPVCATDSKGNTRTFPNPCALTAYNCQNPDGAFHQIKDGACTP